MKKIFLLFVISFFTFPIISFAEDNDIVVESVMFISKSENSEEVSKPTVDKNNISLDLKLYDPKDYVEYELTLKNNSEEKYTFGEMNSKIDKEYITYEFNVDGSNELNPGESTTIKVKVTYREKVPANMLVNDSLSVDGSISISLTKENKIIINPPTGVTNPTVCYGLIIVSSLGILTLLKVNKKYKILTVLITTALFIPLYTSANEKVDIDVNAKITIDGKEAYFINGIDFNIKVKQLVGDDISVDGTKTNNYSILQFIQSNNEPMPSDKEAKNLVSTPESKYEIYIWFDSGTLYWWSEDKSPNLNESSRAMFNRFTKLSDISGVRDFDTSLVTDMAVMFAYNRSLTDLKPLKNWDVSSVVEVSGMFQLCNLLTSLEGLENWNTSSFKNTYGMFTGQKNDSVNVNDLTALRNWDMSNVTDMRAMFQYNNLKSLNGLENWNISSAQSLHATFHGNGELSDISALKNWNTTNVESLQGLFSYTSVSDISPIYNWNVSKVKSIQGFLGNNSNIIEADLSEFDFGNLTNAKNILNVTPNLNRIKTPKVYPTDVNVKINLPATFEDENGNQYTQLDNTCPTQIWLTKVQ